MGFDGWVVFMVIVIEILWWLGTFGQWMDITGSTRLRCLLVAGRQMGGEIQMMGNEWVVGGD